MSAHDNKCEVVLTPQDMNRLGLCLCKERALKARLAEAEQSRDRFMAVVEAQTAELTDKAARLADAVRLLEGWHTAYHADAGMEGLDDDTTTWLAGISPFTPDSASLTQENER